MSLAQSAGDAEYTDCISADPINKCPGYDIKQSDDEASVMQELWRIWSTLSLLLLPVPLWPGVVAPDRVRLVLSMDRTNLCICAKRNC